MKIKTIFYFSVISILLPQVSFADIQVHGFIRPTYSFATDSVSSFGYATGTGPGMMWQRDNQVAATESSPESGVSNPHSARSHWTVGQSRIGLNAKHGNALGKIEIDFVDFDHSNATTSIRPRLRVLGASFEFNKSISFFAGQDWDIIAGPKPFTYNFVSLYFRAGNTGFMRPQFRITVNDDSNRELFSWAIGASGINDSHNASAVERGVAPAVGIRYYVFHSASAALGIAALGAPVRTESPTNSSNTITRAAWIGKIFAELEPTSNLSFRGNIFGGANPQSTGAPLSLASASYSGNQSEVGGFLTGDLHSESKTFSFLFGTGLDRMLANSETRAGQLIQNWASRLGTAWKFAEGTSFFTELTYYKSRYHWPSASTGLETINSSAKQFEGGLVVEI